jgi:hypothetical protein
VNEACFFGQVASTGIHVALGQFLLFCHYCYCRSANPKPNDHRAYTSVSAATGRLVERHGVAQPGISARICLNPGFPLKHLYLWCHLVTHCSSHQSWLFILG